MAVHVWIARVVGLLACWLVAYCILVQARPPLSSRQGLKVGCVPMYDIQYVHCTQLGNLP